MILKKFNNSPEKRIPTAMALVTLGLLLVVLNIVWSRIGWLNAHPGPRWKDFARGVAAGAGMVLEIYGVVLAATALRHGRRS